MPIPVEAEDVEVGTEVVVIAQTNLILTFCYLSPLIAYTVSTTANNLERRKS